VVAGERRGYRRVRGCAEQIIIAQKRTGALRSTLASAKQMAERTVSAARNLALPLRPSMLDDFGLAPALHSQAREISRRTRLRVEISDEEVSEALPDEHKNVHLPDRFDVSPSRGLGLVGMEERVRRLGGEFEVQSEPGNGPLVRVELPLAEAEGMGDSTVPPRAYIAS